MAQLSNHARVGEALRTLAAALEPWIATTLAHHLPRGPVWTDLLAAKDRRLERRRDYSRTDLQCQLRVLTERMDIPGVPFPFGQILSRGEQNLAGELRDVRNNWAHNGQFSADDTYRALDTTERLLKAVGNPTAAAQIRRMKENTLRIAYSSETRRDTRTSAVAMPDLGENGLTPWRDVVRPHKDVVEGNFARAEFAADLHQVSHGEGAAEYSDPVHFYERTYLTEGLKTLLTMTAKRLTGNENTQAVINLQTTFGGGKTHSMLAAWHLAGGTPLADLPQDVQDLLGGMDVPLDVRRVAIVGNELAPGQPSAKDDGTVVHTIWGELAWQLGGARAYELIAEADRTGTNPGSALRTLIEQYAPALILIDEWVAYARGLYGRNDLPGGSFDTQFSFAQQLTAAVQGVPGALLLVSIPASDIRADGTTTRASELEIGGEGGREALQRLQHVVARVAHNWSPATSEESFEIVRRRLFADLDAEAIRKRDAVVKRFADYYRNQRGELPRETFQPGYEERLRAAYPIHPELFDRLYGDWSALEKFQRTRGVLRLMSSVVHALVRAGDDSPLIMPGSVPLDDAAVRDEITGYLDDAWRIIIEKDVDGENATPLAVDRSRPLFGKRALTRRIARALFLGSAATLEAGHKGLERQKLFLGVAMPGDTLGNFGSSLQLLTDQATYVYNEGTRSWYDRQPSLNRLVVDTAKTLPIEDVHRRALAVLKGVAGTARQFTDVVVGPTSTGEVPDAQSVRLVLLHPLHTVAGRASAPGGPGAEFAEDLLRRHGSSPRTNTNTLIMVAPDEDRWEDAEHALRLHMAWDAMASPESVRIHDLTQSQADQARLKVAEMRSKAERAVSAAWIWALHPVQDDGARPYTIGAIKLDGSKPSVAARAGSGLAREDLVLTETAPISIGIELTGPNLRARWNQGYIRVGDLWDIYTRYPYMPRLRDKRVFLEALEEGAGHMGWETGGLFAFAAGYDAERGDFVDLRLPVEDDPLQICDDTLLVAPRLARAQRDREEAERAARRASAAEASDDAGTGARDDAGVPGGGTPTGGPPGTRTPGTGGGSRRTPGPAVVTPEPERPRNVAFNGTVELDPGRDIADQLRTLAVEVIEHLQRADADGLEITLTVNARKYAGFDDNTVRTLSENARTLGLKPGRFGEV